MIQERGNNNMKYNKKVIAVVLAGTMTISSVVPAFAAENSSEKEEVIYINLDAEGTVKDIYAVNIFGKGDVVDYGDYDSVEMLNVNADIQQNGDKITFSTDSDRAYYKGKMSNTQIPWNISIRYYLNGKEYTAEELAGKSGKLEIKFKITENKNFKGSFFDDYALQASFTLDTEKCQNIVAKNATLANIGSKKQISYTILPGEGIDTAITADVKDFEMSAAAINGIPLSMDIDVDDEELMDQVTELLDAIEKLDDGAGELNDGVSELKEGAQGELASGVSDLKDGAGQLQGGAAELKNGGTSLKDGASELKTGTATLDGGIRSLNQGIVQIQKGLDELNSKSPELTKGSADVKNALAQIQSALSGVSTSADQLEVLQTSSQQILDGINQLSSGLNELNSVATGTDWSQAAELKTANSQAIEMLGTVSGQIDGIINQCNTIIANLNGYADNPVVGNLLQPVIAALNGLVGENGLGGLKSSLTNITTLLGANNVYIDKSQEYIGEVNAAVAELTVGASALQTNYTQFNEAIKELVVTLQTMLSQVSELKAGINTLVAEYEKLDSGINEYTGGVSQIVAGYSQIRKGSSDLVNGSAQLVSGSDSLYSGTAELLHGIVEFYDATGTLKDGTGQLDEGVAELLVGISELYDGTGELKEGTGQLRDETDGMDTEISDKIDEMLASFTGEDFEAVSFVSEKNTNIDSVQFVIQTEAVEVEEVEEEEKVEEESKSFIEKLKDLF